MQINLQFRNFEGLDHIRDYVESSVDQFLGKFESWRQFDVQIFMGMVKARSATHVPVFECEVLVNGKGLQRSIFAKKASPDFYKAVRSCLKATEKSLRRASKIRVSHRRRLAAMPEENFENVA